jgi:hypothetical protein
MKSITKVSRINTVTQVIQHTYSGMTAVDAWGEVGMARSSLYYIVKRNPGAIVDTQAIIDISNSEQLVLNLKLMMKILRRSFKMAYLKKPHR